MQYGYKESGPGNSKNMHTLTRSCTQRKATQKSSYERSLYVYILKCERITCIVKCFRSFPSNSYGNQMDWSNVYTYTILDDVKFEWFAKYIWHFHTFEFIAILVIPLNSQRFQLSECGGSGSKNKNGAYILVMFCIYSICLASFQVLMNSFVNMHFTFCFSPHSFSSIYSFFKSIDFFSIL